MVNELGDLVGRTVEVRTATVITPPVPGVAPQLVLLALQPGNEPGEGRMAYIGAGALQGLLTPLLPQTEVLVLIPGGDAKRCIILGALHSAKNPLPPTWTGLNNRFQAPLGNELRSAEGIPADGIVLGNFLVAFLTYIQAMQTFMTVLQSTPASPATGYTAAVVTAATTFQTETATFLASLVTSAAFVDPDSGGLAGAPFASTLNRATG